MIKNLSQLKKALKEGHNFKIVKHYLHPQYTGQIRCVQKMQTNGMYTGIAGDPTAAVSKMNRGLGCWFRFGKASDWKFENDICTQILNGKPVWEITII